MSRQRMTVWWLCLSAYVTRSADVVPWLGKIDSVNDLDPKLGLSNSYACLGDTATDNDW